MDPHDQNHLETISRELSLPRRQVENTVRLLAEGATVPFIARYRKEATGGLDEVRIIGIRDRLAALAELAKRRQAIRASLAEQGVLTDELSSALDGASTLARLEDLYLPYRPKRKTRAGTARERGLEPLAELLLEGDERDPVAAALRFVDPERGVASPDAALSGARDIVAERASENAEVREQLRLLYAEHGLLTARVVKGKETAGSNYRDYFDWSEPAKRAPSHRALAVLRGAEEGVLVVHLRPPEEEALPILFRAYSIDGDARGRSPGGSRRSASGGASPAELRSAGRSRGCNAELRSAGRNRGCNAELRSAGRTSGCNAELRSALEDGYRRLLAPSMETEARNALKARADREAIAVFSANLRELLLAPPLGRKRVLSIDPGLRTGCKVVCLDEQGNLLHNETIFPLPPAARVAEARSRIEALCSDFAIEAIAVGNGTGGREATAFLEEMGVTARLSVVMVNESGASVYSASEVARREFPKHDVTVRGAVSIGRRLMDPLAELVKIDPKSIGVGQYQHDVDQKQLLQALDDVVSVCVNAVGVEVNTASIELLARVSGLSSRLAESIVRRRRDHGPFASRKEFLKVPGMGARTFEQAAGFLRIHGAKNPLDASAVHPERYATVQRMARDLGCSVAELIGDEKRRGSLRLADYVTEEVGLPTLEDIIAELEKPGRDPREAFEPFAFAEGIRTIEDLRKGMRLPGVVTNITAFGAFVDVGVHNDGLVHISQLADRFVRDPHEIVRVGQRVEVTVLEIDIERHRVGLSMKEAGAQGRRDARGS